MKKIILNASDSYELDVHIFEVEQPKAVVQVIHGMEEHQKRYENFIKFLNDNGFSVVSSNMRGHGESAPTLGFFKDKNGHKQLIQDQLTITHYIQEHFKNVPIYIFSHSMGTIITRVLLQQNSKLYSKVVLSGYPNYQSATPFGIFLSGLMKTFRGAKYKSKFLNTLSIGTFNKQIKNAKTPIDWICANDDTINNYLRDPYCGIGFTCSAFNDLFKLVSQMHKYKKYKNVNTNIPILLLRGEDDPCVGGVKGSADSIKVLNKAGFTNLTPIAYPGMRHEILNEKENIKVYKDVLNFYKS